MLNIKKAEEKCSSIGYVSLLALAKIVWYLGYLKNIFTNFSIWVNIFKLNIVKPKSWWEYNLFNSELKCSSIGQIWKNKLLLEKSLSFHSNLYYFYPHMSTCLNIIKYENLLTFAQWKLKNACVTMYFMIGKWSSCWSLESSLCVDLIIFHMILICMNFFWYSSILSSFNYGFDKNVKIFFEGIHRPTMHH